MSLRFHLLPLSSLFCARAASQGDIEVGVGSFLPAECHALCSLLQTFLCKDSRGENGVFTGDRCLLSELILGNPLRPKPKYGILLGGCKARVLPCNEVKSKKRLVKPLCLTIEESQPSKVVFTS